MEIMILEAITMGVGGILILFGLAYEVIMHETHARIYRVHRLDNWYDKED